VSDLALTSTGRAWLDVTTRIEAGARLVGLYGTAGANGTDSTVVTAVLAEGDHLDLLDMNVEEEYPALTPAVPAAFWYERVLHDQFGVLPVNHPRLDPLVHAGMHDSSNRAVQPPRPGERGAAATQGPAPGGPAGTLGPTVRLFPSEQALPRHLRGEGLFTIPHGPVRSGVVESLEFLVETPGEDIPRLQIRVFAKHRGVEVSFEGRDALEGVFLAERVEGTASVAHASAYCQALEDLAGVQIPPEAALVRMLHAELERIVGHLEVVARLCESSALAVGLAKFTGYKEEVQRLRHDLCGSRFGRSVVVPGGVAPQRLDQTRHHREQRVHTLRKAINHDRDLLMVTSSFLDRLRGTGFLDPTRAAEAGAVGPVGRASSVAVDVRADRPYGAYRDLQVTAATPPHASLGDVQARLEVRLLEIDGAFDLVEHALEELAHLPEHELNWAHRLGHLDGRATGSVEGPQGEIVYALEVRDGQLVRVWPRTASMHNLMLFHDVFHTDVLTDFPFIEASFAVSNAGVVL
jgi:formate hydrogenlyase subunit 5